MNGFLIGFSTFFNNLQSFGNCWSSTTLDSCFRPVRLVHHSTFSCAVVHFGSCILEWANVDWTTMSSLRQCFAATAFRGTAAVAVGSRLGWDIGVVPRMKVERIGQVSIKWCILTGSHGLVVWYFALMCLMCMLHAHFLSPLGSQSLLPVAYRQLQVRVCCKGVHHNRNLRVGAPLGGHRTVEVWLHLFTSSLHICWSEILKL